MYVPRRPVKPVESLTHTIRTQYRRLHVRQKFFQLPISAEARDLLTKLALFMNVSTYEVRLDELAVYLYNYNRHYQELLGEILSVRNLGHQSNSMTVVFNEHVLGRIGVKVIDRHRIHQETQGTNLTPEQLKLYEQAVEVMKAYNKMRSEFYQRQDNFVPSPLKFTGVLKNAAVSVAKFCNDHQITDYYLYLMTICHHRKWDALPYLNHCHQPWCYDIYTNNKDDVTGLRVEQEQLDKDEAKEQEARTTGRKKSIFRDIFSTCERIKLNFQRTGERHLCMAHFEDTLGHHPKSKICKSCQLAESCRTQLDLMVREASDGLVDILALREGKQDLAIMQKQLDERGVGLDLYDGTTSSARNRIEGRIGV